MLLLAGLAGAFALVLFSALGRAESRAHWRCEAGLARSRRLDRRAFLIAVVVVAAMVAGGATLYLNWTPPCEGKIVVVRGPDGRPLECLCEEDRPGACVDAGPLGSAGRSAARGQASPKPWRRMNGPKLCRSGTEYWRALSSDQP